MGLNFLFVIIIWFSYAILSKIYICMSIQEWQIQLTQDKEVTKRNFRQSADKKLNMKYSSTVHFLFTGWLLPFAFPFFPSIFVSYQRKGTRKFSNICTMSLPHRTKLNHKHKKNITLSNSISVSLSTVLLLFHKVVELKYKACLFNKIIKRRTCIRLTSE